MPIPTQTELAEIVQDAIRCHLDTGYIGLWPRKPRVFLTIIELDLALEKDGVWLFGKFSLHRPSETAEWDVNGFTISTRHVSLDSFGEHILRLTVVQEILRRLKRDLQAFRNS